jgi:hypothetical protein
MLLKFIVYKIILLKRKLDSTYQLLAITQQAPPSYSNLALELHLKSLLDEYLIQEESL